MHTAGYMRGKGCKVLSWVYFVVGHIAPHSSDVVVRMAWAGAEL